jgi:hypothetical protein
MGAGTYKVDPDPNLLAANIRQGVTIGGVAGSYALQAPNASDIRAGSTVAGVIGTFDNMPTTCSSNDQEGCVTDATYKAANLQMLAAGNVKSGVTIAGVTGTYNGATVPNDCSGNGQIGCVSTSTWKSADLTNLTAGNIKAGATVAGVTGTYNNMPATCSGNGQQGCVTDSTYKAANLTGLIASNIKAGATVAGVTGQYPSATYPLTGADNTADLDNAHFDAYGTRYTYQGDADLATSANIKSSVTIFGMVGTLADVGTPSAWDIRKSTVIGPTTGSAKMTCRDRNGTASSADKCTGESYQDITGNSQTCTSSPSTCIYKDNISGLMFAKTGGAKTWANADSYCTSLVVNGISGWRLADREELQRAFIQGISYTTSLVNDGTIAYWSATAGSLGRYVVRIMDTGVTADTSVTSSTPGTLCVK